MHSTINPNFQQERKKRDLVWKQNLLCFEKILKIRCRVDAAFNKVLRAEGWNFILIIST